MPTSAQAPAQLRCTRQFPQANGPFLVSPFTGWTEIFSYVDHDLPDYSVDGKIVLANGLTATAADGQQSDMFPAYWSPALRQYINYDGHNGYDFGISYQPVVAAASGTVQYAGWNGPGSYFGYGQMVLINHHNGYTTLYGHLSQLEVQQGDKVQAGQEIGISGSTGRSSGPHLHFSVFHNCHVTDPYGWAGHGSDPLQSFDKETSEYLWLPGRDPLVVNALPNWPAYPQGLHLSSFSAARSRLATSTQLPPADRLLLLALPEPVGGENASPALALTRTEEAMTAEMQTLTPLLAELQRQGLVSSYQTIPAAAAIWVRGSASAAELEGLPGVASLSGVEPRDLDAAQRGMAHAVLIQIGKQQLPSLWPVGFRSALQSWRPLVTTMEYRPLVGGFTLPGASVTLKLIRHGALLGTANAVADQTSGGFVLTMHDATGTSINARPGDRITVMSGGRASTSLVVPLHLAANRNGYTGHAPANTSVALQYPGSGIGLVSRASNSDKSGAFAGSIGLSVPVGQVVVASIGNAEGNEEAVSASVPGLDIQVGTGLVRGWTRSSSSHLLAYRGGKLIRTVAVRPGTGGAFQINLDTGHAGFNVSPGDTLVLKSRVGMRSIHVPDFGATLRPGQHEVSLAGPANSRILARYVPATGRVWSRSALTDATGHGSFALPDTGLRRGDSLTLESSLPSGDHMSWTLEARYVDVHVGNATVTGTIRPGAVISIRALDSRGHTVGGFVTGSDPVHGTFDGRLLDGLGRRMKFGTVRRFLVHEESTTLMIKTRPLTLRLDPTANAVRGTGPARQSLLVHLRTQHGSTKNRAVVIGPAGTFSVAYPDLRSADVEMGLSDGFVLERRAIVAVCASKHNCGIAGQH